MSRSRTGSPAYGYGSCYQPASTSSTRPGSIIHSVHGGGRRSFAIGDDSFSGEAGDLNFAQRLVLANEHVVTNIADPWVASAMNADNERCEVTPIPGILGPMDLEEELEAPDFAQATHVRSPAVSGCVLPALGTRTSMLSLALRNDSLNRATGRLFRQDDEEQRLYGTPLLGGARRTSYVPSLFAHTGLRTPPVFDERYQDLGRVQDEESGSVMGSLLHPQAATGEAQRGVEEKAPSMTSMLPLMIIAQYGLLALHNTTHDQVFYSYVVS